MRTPSQTIGPFFGFALPYSDGPPIVPPWRAEAIRIRGRVLDGKSAPVPDALVEIWQPDSAGRIAGTAGALYRDDRGFGGFGRCATGRDGGYWFSTIRPGAAGSAAAPHAALLIFARGLLKPVATRIYFPEDATAHAMDAVLSLVPRDRRPTLVAVPDGDRCYRFDVRLQGEGETVFFAL